MRKLLLSLVLAGTLTACSGGGSEKAGPTSTTRPPTTTTTTIAAAVLMAEMSAEIQRSCDAAMSSGEDTAVEFDARWSAISDEVKLLAAAQQCVKARYGEQYLQLVRPSNCANDRLQQIAEEVYGPDDLVYESDWPEIQSKLLPAIGTLAGELVKFYEGLLGSTWPTEVQSDVEKLAADISAEAALLQAQSEVSTYISFIDDTYDTNRDSNTAGTVRAKLGLPSNVGAASDDCAPT